MLRVLQVLKDALTKLHADGEKHSFYQPVHTYVLNPKVFILLTLALLSLF